MAAPRFCSSRSYGFFSVLLIVCNTTLFVFAQDSLRNSSRECAICHVRWVDAFDRGESEKEKDSLGAMERSAGSGDMCLSCHDGSVADSRFKVWGARHHSTDVIPSPSVKIPTDKFPLDPEGRMTCATCHTAHAVPNSSDIRTVVFLRQPNIDSSLCLACHSEHAQKNSFQHPLGRMDKSVPRVILDAGGKTSQDGQSILCQTCHGAHGTQNAGMLILPPAQLCVACHEDKGPETSPPAGAPIHHIGRTYPGFRPPPTLVDQKAVFGSNGELDCLSCHRLHNASGASPLLIRKNEDGSLCLECHQNEKTVIHSPHDFSDTLPPAENAENQSPATSGVCGSCHRIHGWARKVQDTKEPHSSACIDCHTNDGPGSHNRPYIAAHPVGISVPEGKTPPLPLDKATQQIGCLTCHDPHTPLSPEQTSEKAMPSVLADATIPKEIAESNMNPAVEAPRSFLRRPGSQLCILCHDNKADALPSPHDPATFAPEVRKRLGMHNSIGSCRVCHATHKARGPYLWAQPALISDDGTTLDLCGACHKSDIANTLQGTHHPVAVPRSSQTIVDPNSLPPAEVLPRIECIGCHEPHGSLAPSVPRRSSAVDSCVDCHADQQGIRNSVHDPAVSSWSKDLGVVSTGACVDCHVIHGSESEGAVRRFLPGKDGSHLLCQTCHREGGPGKSVEALHAGKVVATEPKEPLVYLPMSDGNHIRCSTCHDIHQKTQNPSLLRAPRQDSSLCLVCHDNAHGLLGSPHDLRISVPEWQNSRGETSAQSGPCGACHQMHPASDEKERDVAGADYGKLRCTSCHTADPNAPARIPQFTNHPEVTLFNRISPGQPQSMPTFDKNGRPSQTGAITCLTCHEPHILAAETAGGNPLFLRQGTNQRLCADCHGAEALWRYLYYHKNIRNPAAKDQDDLSKKRDGGN